jgi:cellulose synthase/poly-beta-1,6-N-acetylglucosamine synthase-like glycosyltransferase/peptidoglycan/xylan/chitin deacetylase (PgdA/CDA1 family)/spore germination protein YaaH
MNRQIFFDPQRKRWKRLRRILDAVAVFSTVILVLFFLNVVKTQHLPELLLPTPKRNYRAIQEQAAAAIKAKYSKGARRKTSRKPSEIPFNSGESLRAAYYVDDDAGSFASLKSHIHQIDMLFPDWLYVTRADGTLEGAFTAEAPLRAFPVLDAHGVHSVDPQNKVHDLIAAAHEDTEIFPELKNYNVLTQEWDQHATAMVKDPAARLNLERQIMTFLAANPGYHGLSLDLEDLPDDAQAPYHLLIGEMYGLMHPKNLRLFVNESVGADDSEFAQLAQQTDGILLMNYDQHEETGGPGPIAAQDWFENNLRRVLKVVPKEKLICSIGNYGYDWTMSLPAKGKHGAAKVLNADDISVQDGWQAASDANADVRLAGDELNPHFAYDDEDNHVRHQVWMLDAVTALNELRAARQMGVQTIALWRLGREDPSIWSVWDHPSNVNAPQSLKQVPPGDDVVTDGDGDILHITGEPHPGSRTIDMDSYNWTVTDEHMLTYPSPYTIEYYGYKPGVVALSFDDGPDPKWTPKVLDVLKQQNVKATFMMIGEQAQDNVGLMKRVMAEGHEIGNHTWTHPDISEISPGQVQLQLNLTERLFGSKLGVKPLFFRPPYSIDQEPDTNDQTGPAYLIQKMGYTIVGNKIDTGDWDERQRKTPEGILNDVLVQLDLMKTKPQFRGSIILMHDGGGDRTVTIAALPVLIAGLRAHGYVFQQVSDLMGKTRAEVMPPLNSKERWQARVDSVAFFAWAFFNHFVVSLFFLGDILMSARLILVGIFALIDRLRRRPVPEVVGGFLPRVAVLIPAYNEEKVIVRTIRSVLNSDYPHLRIIVIDDGSPDRTSEVAREAYPDEIAAGMLTILRTVNGGKAEALNFAVSDLKEEFYVGIDADTVIAADAVSKLVAHFADPQIGAVAGNAKVGNRVNLWTRWQALEYITSQNFERRALDLFDVVTVVPGAIGAWRTEAVRQGGCYPVNTVAEDADLTMNLLEQGYKVIYEDRALAFTEAPATARGLMRQRFRWSFGTLQAVYKHQGAFLKNKAMGLFALPNILVFQILLPLVSPFIDLMFVAGVVHYLLDRHFHPEAANAANFEKLLTFFLAFLLIDFVTSALAFSLERRHAANKGDGWLLFHIWLQRFAYRQLFSLVLFKTVKRAIDGRPFNWDKLERTAQMSAQTERLTATR